MRSLLLPVGLLACLLLPACGSGGGGSTPIPPVVDPFEAMTFQPASAVVGQDSFVEAAANAGGVAADTLSSPTSAIEAGGRLWIADVANHRVLGYAGVPAGVGAAAAVVLGQPDATSSNPGLSATAMNQPVSLTSGAGRLYVSDFANNRVLIFGSLPLVSTTPATAVVGQADLDSDTAGTTRARLRGPVGVHAGGGRLVVADAGNHRVLIWNSLPSASGQNADLVLGQADFDSATVNAGTTPAAHTLSSPYGVWTDGTRVVVADRGNNRVLVWTTFPTVNGQAADLVLGQTAFVSVAPASGPSGMRQPSDVTGNGLQLVVADGDNHRVLLWNAFPDTSGAPADVVLGQSSFSHVAPNDDNQDLVADPTPSARTLNGLGGFLFARLSGTRLWIGDFRNNRVLRIDGD